MQRWRGKEMTMTFFRRRDGGKGMEWRGGEDEIRRKGIK